jgi:hypothetical protein
LADGGSVKEGIDVAAQMAVVGIDPLDFLRCNDEFDRGMLLELGNRIMYYKHIMDENLAKRIANEVGKLFSK